MDRLVKVSLVFAILAACACDDSSSAAQDGGVDNGPGVCIPGSLGCPCMENGACDHTLICSGTTCVLP